MTHVGYIILLVALTVIFFSTIAAFIGARTDSRRIINGARYSVIVTAGLYTLALALVLYSFIAKDFSLRMVSSHASSDLPALYSLCAVYADKAGSLFFWGWLISLFSAVLSLQNRTISNQRVLGYALFILGIVQIFFLALVTLASNVFEKNTSVVTEGFGLNPLLQNFGMLIHPPLLYIGFAGFTIVFALMMALLIVRSPILKEQVVIRKWAIFSWCILGIGNMVGMWWSYNELGWGGYWAWDPVENAGLMPLLLSTAFIHSLVMIKQRSYLYKWSYALILATFVFILFSPFITHGGIESPLHGFYGSNFPPYILAAISITVLCSVVLLVIRRNYLKDNNAPFSVISRESAFLITNIILVVLVLVIFLGTILPKVMELITGTRIAIERGFFDRTCGPILLILVFFMGICPLLGWGKTSWNAIKRNFLYSLIFTVVIIAVVLIIDVNSWYVAILIGLVCFPLATVVSEWVRGSIARHRSKSENCLRAFINLITNNRSRYGGLLVHLGIVMIALGIIASSFFSIERTETIEPGESINVGKYEFVYEELMLKQDSTRISAVASVTVLDNGREISVMEPSYDYWFQYKDNFAEVAVRSTPAKDLFVSLIWTSYDPADKAATFRILVSPLIIWIWIGGGFFLLGGVLAYSAGRSGRSQET
jgi:cytochrome c-type biogenesis protein CcmF